MKRVKLINYYSILLFAILIKRSFFICKLYKIIIVNLIWSLWETWWGFTDTDITSRWLRGQLLQSENSWSAAIRKKNTAAQYHDNELQFSTAVFDIGSSIFWQTLWGLHCNVDIINFKSSAVTIKIKTPLYEYLYDIWDYEHSIQVCYINTRVMGQFWCNDSSISVCQLLFHRLTYSIWH